MLATPRVPCPGRHLQKCSAMSCGTFRKLCIVDPMTTAATTITAASVRIGDRIDLAQCPSDPYWVEVLEVTTVADGIVFRYLDHDGDDGGRTHRANGAHVDIEA